MCLIGFVCRCFPVERVDTLHSVIVLAVLTKFGVRYEVLNIPVHFLCRFGEFLQFLTQFLPLYC